MKQIILQIIPHEEQRLKMIGDWFFDQDDNLTVRVTDLGDWRLNFIIARHELDEAMLCKYYGVTTEQVDKYDLEHPDNGSSDYADNQSSPYYQQHNDALAAEWIMSRLLDIDWKDYERRMKSFE